MSEARKPRLIPWWLYLSVIISSGIAIALYRLELPLFAIPFLGLAGWQIQQIISRRLDEYDQQVKKENKQIQATAAVNPIPDVAASEEIPDYVQHIWEQAVWLANHFKSLWPGGNKSEELKEEYLSKLEDYYHFLTNQSISISNFILEPAEKIYRAIHEYKIGKDLRWTEPYEPESSKEGGKMMSTGAKNFNRAFSDLRQAIRHEYGVDK